MTRIALIDLDSACYAAGASEDAGQACESLEYAIAIILQACDTEEWEGYIENPKAKCIFRSHVAVTRPYKGNRAHVEKPRFLGEAKAKAIEMGARVCTYVESEDAVAIRHGQIGAGRAVICSIDKDMRQVAGTHFDYRKARFISVTPAQAHYNFWTQMATGDGQDNIVGIPRFGPGKAAALLGEPPADGEEYNQCEIEAKVISLYKERGLPYSYLVEQGRLLYLLRYIGDVWMPPISEEEYNGG